MVKETFSTNETYELGRRLGMIAQPGDIFCLNGDLGTGKTVLTQGFAEGLGIRDTVNSPTFTIVQEYHDGRIPLYHFDVYRIGDVEEMDEIGYEEYFFGEGVCLIEWSQLIEEILPEDVTDILVEKDEMRADRKDFNFDYRKITITGRHAGELE